MWGGLPCSLAQMSSDLCPLGGRWGEQQVLGIGAPPLQLRPGQGQGPAFVSMLQLLHHLPVTRPPGWAGANPALAAAALGLPPASGRNGGCCPPLPFLPHSPKAWQWVQPRPGMSSPAPSPSSRHRACLLGWGCSPPLHRYWAGRGSGVGPGGAAAAPACPCMPGAPCLQLPACSGLTGRAHGALCWEIKAGKGRREKNPPLAPSADGAGTMLGSCRDNGRACWSARLASGKGCGEGVTPLLP